MKTTSRRKVGRERLVCTRAIMTLCWYWQPKATKLDFNAVAWLLLGELWPDFPVCVYSASVSTLAL
jgi:hypothetical protein